MDGPTDDAKYFTKQPVSSIRAIASITHLVGFLPSMTGTFLLKYFCSTSYLFISPSPYVDKVQCLCYSYENRDSDN